ncbi:MAG TPA: hypothetical protein VKW06_17205 [Candidatus Angelobacter sp.]|nr:hypothetical protein [Candidatus Angelobacter sp.]
MLRFRSLFLLLGTAALFSGLSAAQAPTSSNPGSSDPQPQAKAGAQDQNQDQTQSQGQDKDKPKSGPSADDPNAHVLVLKAPVMTVAPQFKPELRTVDLEKRPRISENTRMQLIQLMDAEFAHTRKYFPLGDKSLVINPQGVVTPADAALFQNIQSRGAAAKVGDRVQITNIVFHEKSISLQINGGPKRKSKWYQHVSIGVGGPGGGVAPLDTNQAQPTGAEFTLQFPKQIPEMNAEELRKLLSPVLDFGLKSAGQVYAETLPPKVRDAIKRHEVLVGMNKDMVVLAKDRPQQKVRDKDENGKDYEEWIYGQPPQDVVFVRFAGDEVTMVKTARIGQETLVKTEKEVDVKDGVATMAALAASKSPEDVKQGPQQADQEEQPKAPPTLRRAGEGPDPSIQQRAPNGPVSTPQSEPEWGTGGKKPDDGQQPSPDPGKPPQ